MSNIEALAPHSVTPTPIDDIKSPSDTGYTYQRDNGIIEHAVDRNDATLRCPWLAEQSIKNPAYVELTFDLMDKGRAIIAGKKEIELMEPDSKHLVGKLEKNKKKEDGLVDNFKPKPNLLETDENVFSDNTTEKQSTVKVLPKDVPDEHKTRVEDVRAEAIFDEPNNVLNVADPVHEYENLDNKRLEVNESLELETSDDLEIDRVNLLVQPALEYIQEVTLIRSPEQEVISVKVEDEVLEHAVPLVAANPAPEFVIAHTNKSVEQSLPPEKIAIPYISKESESSVVHSKNTIEIKVDSPLVEIGIHNENLTPIILDTNNNNLIEPTSDTEVKTEVIAVTHEKLGGAIVNDTTELRTLSPDHNNQPQKLFYQESSQFESVARPKIIDITTPVLLRDLNFQPKEMGKAQPEKITTFAEVMHDVKGKSFEQSLVEVVKFISSEKDSQEQQQLHEIFNEIRSSLTNGEINNLTRIPDRSMTPEIYENTLALLRLLGHTEPEDMLIQFTEKHGESFLLDTLDYLTSIYELGQNEDLIADAKTIETYNRLLEITSEKPILEPDFDSESEQINPPLDGSVLIQLKLDAEVTLDNIKSTMENDEPYTPDSLMPIEPVQLQSNEVMIIVVEKKDVSKTIVLNPKDVEQLPLSLEHIQDNAEKQTLEQTLAQVALHMPEIALSQSEEFQEVVGDINKLLTDRYLSEKKDKDHNVELSDELIKKTIELVKLLGYAEPEEEVEKFVTEYGTDFLLQALSYITEQNAYKRKQLESTILSAGVDRKNKPEMEVAVFGMTRMFVYVPGI